jgi:hypothetical protein
VWAGAKLELMGRYERQRRKVALDTVQVQTMHVQLQGVAGS